MNEESYHHAMNTIKKIPYWKLNESNILLVNGESLVPNHPTIFLASHISQIDFLSYCVALLNRYEELGEKAVVRPVIADELFLLETITDPRKRLFWNGVNSIINNAGESSVGLIIKRGYSLNKAPRKLAPLLYLRALERGHKLLIYPLAVFSKDGSVDYDGKQLQFKSKHIRGMARHIKGLHVQYAHLTYDYINKKCVVTLGNPKSGDDLFNEDFSFREEIASCTTITSLQLTLSYLALLYESGSVPYIRISSQELTGDLEEILSDIEKRGFNIFNESNHTDEILSFLKKKNLVAVEGESFFLHDKGVHNHFYNVQRNHIKHLNLESIIRKFAEKRLSIR